MSESKHDGTRSVRWPRRFSLLMFLAAFVGAAVPLAWLSSRIKSVKAQNRLAEELRLEGALVYHISQVDSAGRILTSNARSQSPWIVWLAGVDIYDCIIRVDLKPRCGSGTIDLARLKQLPDLRYLSIMEVTIGDKEIRQIAELKQLEHLELGALNFSRTGGLKFRDLGHLKTFTHWTDLDQWAPWQFDVLEEALPNTKIYVVHRGVDKSTGPRRIGNAKRETLNGKR